MKGKFFYFAVGALALAACTSEDIVEDAVQSSNVIGFENVVSKHSRATDLEGNTLSQFNVYGYYITPNNATVAVEVFKNVAVTRADATNPWSYAGDLRYWIPNAKYQFYAYSCGNNAMTKGTVAMDIAEDASATKPVLTISDYICNDTNQDDLVFATSAEITAQEKNNNDVALTFDHLLSKVAAQFTNALPDGYTAEVSNVTIENIYDCGNYEPGKDWTVQKMADGQDHMVTLLAATADALSVAKGEDVVPAATGTAFVLPYNYTKEDETVKAQLKFTVALYNKGEKVLEKNLTGSFSPEWKTGYKYTYAVTLSGDALNLQAIVFTTSTDVSGWTEDSEEPIVLDIDDDPAEDESND